ncbi:MULTISPECIES: hypothetical protein [Synechococcus]|uniref:Uncharacterized protein n=1 Tax=Synechococcus lacustris str. Tous TaxID=1910958 RepID=A0A2P7EBJ3_9SYNE|nr:hypothetical protein [Synechococcus lacustris]PSI00585.1 hypothetical protein C7K08_12360 [Synechococcus lacustris str. Tous]
MAKPVILIHNDIASNFQLQKLERSKLYGCKRRIPVDEDGEPCVRASLTEDGEVIILSGMAAQGWFDDLGRQVEASEIGAQSSDGIALELVLSTLGVSQPLEGPVSPMEVLDLAVSSVYQLTADTISDELAASLTSGEVWRFRFNYRSDFLAETAYLLANDAGIFALIGQPATAPYLQLNAIPPVEAAEGEDTEDVDFEML